MTTQAQAIIERLQRLHSLIRYRVERVADARQPRTQELSLSLILSDLDAAINDIRGMLAEPVTVWIGRRHGGNGHDQVAAVLGSQEAADAWVSVPDFASRYLEPHTQTVDAQGGTDAK